MHASHLVLAALIATPALAQTPATYPADFYASAEPQTALDMIRRTPGFTLQEGDNRRGYAGSLGNVLIDGRRPVAKTQTLEDALQQIPAAQVMRIEILSGADAAGDPSGYSVLANIVRVPAAGQGIWGAGAEYANQGRAAPNGFINWSGRYRDTRYSVGGSSYSLHRDLPGIYRDEDGSGHLVGTGEERSPRTYAEYAVNGQAGRPAWGGELALTGKLKYSRYGDGTTLTSTAADDAPLGGTLTPYSETTELAELGGQYDRSFGPWKWSAIALLTRRHFFSDVSATRLPSGDRFAQALDHRSAENILRLTLARDVGPHRLEAGYERAHNNLDAALNLTFTAGGVSSPIDVPDSNARITERRDDLYISDTWQVSPALSAELRLGYERPALVFRGDTDSQVTYAFVKPSFALTRGFGHNQLVFRLYRDIGQINFDDFVSVASLRDAVINGGNPRLRPQTQWRAELGGDFHFSGRATLSVKLYHSRIRDTADLVPVAKDGTLYDAPGNIGDGRISGVTASLHLPLDPLIPGGTLQADIMAQGSRVTDPLTGKPRRISLLPDATQIIAFRQDLPRRHMAWGMVWTGAPALTRFRFNETDTTRAAPTLDLYVEQNDLGSYSLKATLHSANDAPAVRERLFYGASRAGPVTARQAQDHRSGLWFNIALSRLF